MQWFTEVNDAISILHKSQEDLILVISVEGHAESKYPKLIKMLETSMKGIECEPKFVGLRVPTSSALYQQLSAIYHVVPVPCLFFIRGDGQPIDVIENISVDEIQPRIVDVVKSGTSLKSSMSGRLGESTPKPNFAFVDKKGVITTRNIKNDNPHGNADGKGEVDTPEKQRLQGGGDLVPIQACEGSEGQGDKQTDEMPSTSSEGGAEDWQLSHHYHPYNIAQDQDDVWSPQEPQSEQPTTSRYARSAHIQFRLPSGEYHTHEFPVNTTVRELYEYVGEYIDLPFNHWTLALVFPRRELDEDSGHLTVTDLALVPNGVVLIVPRNGDDREGFLQEAGSVLLTVFSWPLSVVYSLWSYVYSYIFPEVDSYENVETEVLGSEDTTPQYYSGPAMQGPPTPEPSPLSPELTPSPPLVTPQQPERIPPPPEYTPPPPPNDPMPPPLMPMPSSARVTRDGNVHRLRFRRGDDDDNNTWNGNSTQQM